MNIDESLLKRLLGIEKFNKERISTIFLALNSARLFSRSNIFINDKDTELTEYVIKNGLNYEFMFSGVLNYLIFLEQVGSLINCNLKQDNKSDIFKALTVLSELDYDSKIAISELRNTFAHRFGLATKNKTDNSFKFIFTYDNSETKLVNKALQTWNGDFNIKTEKTSTVINIPQFFKLCELTYESLLSKISKQEINFKKELSEQELLTRYTILE